MRNIRLLIEYDGTAYAGWQRQTNARTIQGEIEQALARILREQVTLNGAGRTDAGVHARGQVANFTTTADAPCHAIERGLNGILSDDIVVLNAGEAAPDFHARFSARGRRYSYSISRAHTALERHRCWILGYALDDGLLDRAAGLLAGTHDFRSYCRTQSDVEHHRCTVTDSHWERNGSLFRYHITADRFLHGMVRSLVGTMIDVGRGYTPFAEFENLFALGDRREAGMAAPARGLVLEEVLY